MTESAPATAEETDVRPVVHTGAAGNRSLWLFGGALAIGGLLLFNVLNSARQDRVASTTAPVATTGGPIAAPPPLSLPPGYMSQAEPERFAATRRIRTIEPAPAPVVTRMVERPVPTPAPTPPQPVQQRLPPPVPVVIERPALGEPAATNTSTEGQERVTAGRLRNPAFTVPQGTIVPAVLETALDSTRAGGARAIVSRDVRSFDGSRVLIPRGSRLYGEYTADVSAGQKRALVHWTRLTRPDAVIVELDSPAADPLGRAGVEGDLDTHFFARFGGAILQSVLDIGVGVATRSAVGDAVIIGLPGSTQQIAQQQQPGQVTPTLRVKQGTSVSVFVARDLDFSTVDR